MDLVIWCKISFFVKIVPWRIYNSRNKTLSVSSDSNLFEKLGSYCRFGGIMSETRRTNFKNFLWTKKLFYDNKMLETRLGFVETVT